MLPSPNGSRLAAPRCRWSASPSNRRPKTTDRQRQHVACMIVPTVAAGSRHIRWRRLWSSAAKLGPHHNSGRQTRLTSDARKGTARTRLRSQSGSEIRSRRGKPSPRFRDDTHPAHLRLMCLPRSSRFVQNIGSPGRSCINPSTEFGDRSVDNTVIHWARNCNTYRYQLCLIFEHEIATK